LNEPTLFAALVSRRASPPAADIRYTCVNSEPGRRDRKATVRPSGDHWGARSPSSFAVNRVGSPPDDGTIQIS
jgi:hypothetical protein